ncbi:MAG: electron transfer flavoprotein subunit alpha/FixB family protein [Raoultibacter sp.]
MRAFVLAERSEAAANLCAGARSVADEIILVALGEMQVPANCADTIAHIAIPEGAVCDDAADTVIAFFDAQSPEVVFVEPTRHLKVVAGKLAAHVGTSVITDVIEFNDTGAANMYFGGIAHKTQKAVGTPIYTVGAGVFADVAPTGANAVTELDWVAALHPLELISSSPIQKSGVDLFKADTVVAAGRGFAEKEDLDMARALCDALGGGLGCSRPLTEGVDWLPSEVYIGVSGLMLSPKVYLGVGISGQMQHMVGCNRATTLFAINKDKNAPIFKQCDYGLVGDINLVLPALTAAL